MSVWEGMVWNGERMIMNEGEIRSDLWGKRDREGVVSSFLPSREREREGYGQSVHYPLLFHSISLQSSSTHKSLIPLSFTLV